MRHRHNVDRFMFVRRATYMWTASRQILVRDEPYSADQRLPVFPQWQQQDWNSTIQLRMPR